LTVLTSTWRLGPLCPAQHALFPSTIIAIEPSWRGYDYFMVGEQIVIVDPRSMEIVAIIDA
jgi:hypothetical protein